jgi:nucleoside-diphosphate-sugar epimerase
MVRQRREFRIKGVGDFLKYLVTGSSGFVGRHLVEKISNDPKNIVYAMSKYPIGFKKENVFEITHDLKYPLPNLPEIDIVFHLAARVGISESYKSPIEVIKDNVLSTINLIEYFRDKNIFRIVYSGTAESSALSTELFEYPIPTDELVPLGIADVTNSRWSYASSKMLGEQIVALSGIPYTIVRYSNIYGPGQTGHFVDEFASRASNGDLTLIGWSNTRTFLFVEDAVRATLALSKETVAVNQIYNVGSMEEFSILDVSKIILKILNIVGEPKLLDAPQGSPARRCPDTSKIFRHIGFVPEITLEEGLRITLDI